MTASSLCGAAGSAAGIGGRCVFSTVLMRIVGTPTIMDASAGRSGASDCARAPKRVQTDANDRIQQIADTANARLKLIESKISVGVQDANQVSQDEAEKRRNWSGAALRGYRSWR